MGQIACNDDSKPYFKAVFGLKPTISEIKSVIFKKIDKVK
jgi:hypothetical protein